MEAMEQYVVGFLIDTSTPVPEVVLMRKTKPDWQRGRLNGIGGRVEPGESPHKAMTREFLEETGCVIETAAWHRFADIRRDRSSVIFFRSYASGLRRRVRTIEEEEIVVLPVCEADASNSVDDLPRMLAMAQTIESGDCSRLTIAEID
jgi:8-oxo-dGTP diphosphatase